MKRNTFLKTFIPLQDKYYRVARRLLTSNDEAQDAVQETLVKLWGKKEKLEGVHNKEAYGMTMLKNYCLDRLKSKQAGNLKLVHSNYAEKGIGLEKQTEVNEGVELIHQLMKSLPKTQQVIMHMRDIEQESFEEIAVVMNMKETAVRVALSRARKTIREALIKTYNYGTQ